MKTVDIMAQTFETVDSFLESFEADKLGCAIVDIRMPKMSGLDLQKIIFERAPSIPVIIVTGHGELDMAVDAMRAGAFDFIQKPYKQQYMLDRIQEAVLYS